MALCKAPLCKQRRLAGRRCCPGPPSAIWTHTAHVAACSIGGEHTTNPLWYTSKRPALIGFIIGKVCFEVFLSSSLISLHLAKAHSQHKLLICAPTVLRKSPVKAFSSNLVASLPGRPERASSALYSYSLKPHSFGGETEQGQGRVRHEVTESKQKLQDQ